MKCVYCQRKIEMHKGHWCEVKKAVSNNDVFYIPICLSLASKTHVPDTEAVAIWKEEPA